MALMSRLGAFLLIVARKFGEVSMIMEFKAISLVVKETMSTLKLWGFVSILLI